MDALFKMDPANHLFSPKSQAAACVILLGSLCGALMVSPAAIAEQPASAEQIRFFETKIRPLLVEHCYDCHAAGEQESGLRVDTIKGMLIGGHAGPSVIPGKPDSSLLVTAVTYRDSELEMPPDQRLSDQQIVDLEHWVQIGAPHPDSETVGEIRRPGDVDLEAGRKHWAFVRPSPVQPPRVDAAEPIDAFIATRLRQQGLQRVAAADKRTLIRRATFDLIGLPPIPAEINDFLADQSDDAFAHVIDRLLASPHYGERWGRHWLDVARYADSNGLDENVAHGNAWRYRDYVVESFNDDKPYDQFVVEQLAGDLLASDVSEEVRRQRLIATGFLVLGPKFLAEQDEAKMEMDIIDEQIDTVGRSIMGLTLGCARCHTHKFDPISHHDYYALAGIFKSTRTMDQHRTVAKWHENVIGTPEQVTEQAEFDHAVAQREKHIESLVADATAQLDQPTENLVPDDIEKLFPEATRSQLKELRSDLKSFTKAAPDVPTAMGVIEGNVADTSVHLRGSHLTLGDVVPRRFPEVLVSVKQPEIRDDHSGRLEFARWLTDGNHPLTARVMVNRIWHGHFGKGLVSSVDNFGLQGTPPTHPELLDWLAVRFVDEGWSVKAMHRIIMLSDTYQTSSHFDAENATMDPSNQFYWRHDLRRLEVESIRDALLLLSGKLDRDVGGNLMTYKNRDYVFNHLSKDESTYDTDRRSIYVPVIRNHLYDMFGLFDYSDASVLNGDRSTSTIAPQALFMMNSDFVADQTRTIAGRYLSSGLETKEVVNRLYVEAFGHPASDRDVQHAIQFLENFGNVASRDTAWQAYCQAVVSSNEFIYVQ